MFNFTIIECDQDLMQALINCASIALSNSNFQLKCIPVAICILRKSDDEYVVDPSIEEIKTMRHHQITHKLLTVTDVNKEELIYSSLLPLNWQGAEDG